LDGQDAILCSALTDSVTNGQTEQQSSKGAAHATLKRRFADFVAIREVAPGRLLYVYDVTPAGWGELQEGEFNEIRGVFVTVRKRNSAAH